MQIWFEGSVLARRRGGRIFKRLARVIDPGYLCLLNPDTEDEVSLPIIISGARLEFAMSMIPSKKNESAEILPEYLAAFCIDQWTLQPSCRTACIRWVAYLADLAQNGDGIDFIPHQKQSEKENTIEKKNKFSDDQFLRSFAMRIVRDPDFLNSRNRKDLEERISAKTSRAAIKSLVLRIALAAFYSRDASSSFSTRQQSRRSSKETTNSFNSIAQKATPRKESTKSHPENSNLISWMLYLKTQVANCPSLNRIHSESADLCTVLLDGVVILKLVQDTFRIPLPRDANFIPSPSNRIAAIKNWDIALRALRRSAKLDNTAHLDFLGPPEPLYAALETGRQAIPRRFLRALFDAYKSTRLRLEATPMLQWYEDQLCTYGVGLSITLGTNYITDTRDAFRPAVASAFADGRRMLILLYHILGNNDSISTELPFQIHQAIHFLIRNPQPTLDHTDAIARLDEVLSIALAANLPTFFINGKTFLDALMCANFDLPRDDKVNFVLLQLNYFWQSFRSSINVSKDPLGPFLRLRLNKESILEHPSATNIIFDKQQENSAALDSAPMPLHNSKKEQTNEDMCVQNNENDQESGIRNIVNDLPPPWLIPPINKENVTTTKES